MDNDTSLKLQDAIQNLTDNRPECIADTIHLSNKLIKARQYLIIACSVAEKGLSETCNILYDIFTMESICSKSRRRFAVGTKPSLMLAMMIRAVSSPLLRNSFVYHTTHVFFIRNTRQQQKFFYSTIACF